MKARKAGNFFKLLSSFFFVRLPRPEVSLVAQIRVSPSKEALWIIERQSRAQNDQNCRPTSSPRSATQMSLATWVVVRKTDIPTQDSPNLSSTNVYTLLAYTHEASFPLDRQERNYEDFALSAVCRFSPPPGTQLLTVLAWNLRFSPDHTRISRSSCPAFSVSRRWLESYGNGSQILPSPIIQEYGCLEELPPPYLGRSGTIFNLVRPCLPIARVLC
jgi:hypothetical protein